MAAILFLGVLLFNLCGYRWVIDYLQQQHDEKLTAQLDNDAYRTEDLISIKTPLSLPYYTATPEFERIDGSVHIDGVEYRYVKRRIVNDSLELLCLPNTAKQKLQNAKSDFFELANDLQRPENGKKSNYTIKSVLPEFCDALTAYNLPAPPDATPTYLRPQTQFTSSLFTAPPAQPPEPMHLLS